MSEEAVFWLLAGVGMTVCLLGLWMSVVEFTNSKKVRMWHLGWADGYKSGREDQKWEMKKEKREKKVRR